MQNKISENSKNLFFKTFNEEPLQYKKLPVSGSSRIYYRISSKKKSVIATYNEDKKENTVFIGLSEIFKKNNINVPEIYAADSKHNIYLQEDLGNETLFNKILTIRTGNDFQEELIKLYKKVVEQLANLQIKVSNKVNYSICYP